MSQINSKRKVYLVEDHPITRDGFAQLINYQDDLLVCGQAGSIAAALEEIEEARPDLVVVDVSLADGNGIELVKQLHCKFPRLYLLVLSMHDESLYAERALQAGARGYVMKQESTDLVMAAIRQILQGEIYLSPKVQQNLVR
jgi:DNA-binding NarL/FixJ family response regulator